MTAIDLLKLDAEYGFKQLMEALEGITQPQAWAKLTPQGKEYLHTDGSVQGIALHIASVKWAYASITFRNTELRWHQIADQMEAFEPSWDGALDYLKRGHDYWMASWADLKEEELEEMRPTNYKKELPAWRMIQIMNQHDAYHAGQIATIRYAAGESDTPPMSYAEDIRGSCQDSAAW
ncbi:MAG: DinB family protein [Fimbriimonadaceae bacterium]|nr:DinB family protein [Fimbriimonadaceae bacterium]